MSWISDVRDDLHRLRRTKTELKKFGLLVGTVASLVGVVGLLKHWPPGIAASAVCGGVILVMFGFVRPLALTRVYGVWMAVAFALGWIVSRLILILLYYLVVSPIGLIARSRGKKFIDLEFRTGRDSFWIPKEKLKKTKYEKMV